MSERHTHASAHGRPKWPVRAMVTCALLTAVSVVLARFLIPTPNEVTRFSLEAVPIFLAGMLFGPLPGALTAMRVLQKHGWSITEEHIRRGLASTDWPGRFQIIGHDPLFIIDGGHNPQCIQALEQNIRDYLPGRPLTVLTGVMQDKDYHCMYRGVARYANSFITVTPDNPRSLPAGELAAYIRELGCSATACGTIREGVALALEQAGPDGTVLCYGSLYLIGDVELQLRELRK